MVHHTPIPVRFVDIDAMGHVNNAVHLNYFEEARIAFFRDTIGDDWNWQKHGILLARNVVDYFRPVRLQDRLEVHTSCLRLGNKSLDLQYKLVKVDDAKDEMICSEGISTLVCFDHEKQETIPIPDRWRKELKVKAS